MSGVRKIRTVRLHDPVAGEPLEIRVVTDGVIRGGNDPVDRNKPEWLRVSLPGGETYHRLEALLDRVNLHTVCKEARCPNTAECWKHGTMTIMILGGICTRSCRFCSVDTGNPKGWVDPDEPAHVAAAIAELGIRYAVLTSVDRDDLPDGGASHFARTVEAIKEKDAGVLVEALTPDFQGDRKAVERVLASGVDVFGHNIETVRELTGQVRDHRASYDLSLEVLGHASRYRAGRNLETLIKSSLMLGLGEDDAQIERAMADLRGVGVDILTMGQYLRPTRNHLAVSRYVTPEMFEMYRKMGLRHGFREVFSGPLVRSSYRADKLFRSAR